MVNKDIPPAYVSTSKKILNVVLVAGIFLIIKLLLLPSWHELDKNRIKPPEQIDIKNYSLESWIKPPDGNILPEHFSFTDSPGALIQRSDVAKEGKYSVLLKQSEDSEAYLRYQVNDFVRYKGGKIKLSVWIKSGYKSAAVMAIDIQDGVNPVNVKTYPNNGEWEQVELVGDINTNAKYLLITFKPLDNKNAVYLDKVFLQTFPRVEPLKLDKTSMAVIGISFLSLIIIIFIIYLNKKYLFNLINKILEYFFNIINKAALITSKIPFLGYFKEIPIILFFVYFLYLCWIYHSRIIDNFDFIGAFDNIWFFYHRLLQGSFSQWNPYSLSGRIAIQWNQLPVSIFSPFLMFSEFTLTKYKIISIFGTFLSFLSIYFVGRILKYNKFTSLIAILLFIKCGRYLCMATFVGSTTSFFLFPIAIAVLYYFFLKNNISWFNYFVSISLLSLSFLGNKTEDFIFKGALILLSFIIFGIYQLPDKARMRKYFLLGFFALLFIFLTNAWQLAFLLNAVLDNPRLSVHANILKVVDPTFIKWVFKSLIYQAPLILCIFNILISKILEKWRPNIFSKKLFLIFSIPIIAVEIALLGLMYYSEKIGFHLYWLSNNPETYKTALSLQSSSILIILVYQYFFNQTKSFKNFFIDLAAIFAGCYIAQISFFLWYNELPVFLARFLFLFIIAGSFSFIMRKRQRWLMMVVIIYLFIGETGIYFLNEIAGIPWLSIRANLSLIPCLAIIIFEGLDFSITILSYITYRAIKLFRKVNRLSVHKIVFNAISMTCLFIAFYCIKSYFVPVTNNTYAGSYFFKPTSVEDVKSNMINKDTYKYYGSTIYEAYSHTELVKSHYKEMNHFKRIFPGKYIEKWRDIESNYQFLPSCLERLNTVGLYNTDIPKNLALIFNEIYNDKLTIHPEIGFQQHFRQYKFEDVKKKGTTVNDDFGSSVTIKPNMYNSALFNEILAREDSRTPRVFLCKDVLQFKDYKEEYNYLKNNIINNGLPLTYMLTTSDKSFKLSESDKTNNNLAYTIKFNKDEPENIELEIESNVKAYLVLLDTYGSGWKCYINNKVAPIYKAYVGMRFVAVNPGKQLIKFKYSLPGFFYASIMSISVWFLIIFVLISKKSHIAWQEKQKPATVKDSGQGRSQSLSIFSQLKDTVTSAISYLSARAEFFLGKKTNKAFIEKLKTKRFVIKAIFLSVIIASLISALLIFRPALAPIGCQSYKNIVKPLTKIDINNSSFESWGKSTDGKFLPEHFSFMGSGASIERSDTAKDGKHSVLLRQAPAGLSGSYLRCQVDDFEKYKGKKIRLSAWIKSELKTQAAIAIDTQDGAGAVNVKTYSSNGSWEQIELIGDIDANAKYLLITFKPLDNKNAVYLDKVKLEIVRLDDSFKTILFMLLIISPILYMIYRLRGKSFYDMGIFLFLVIAYLCINHKFFLGKQFAFHDTLWGHHGFLKMLDWWIHSGFEIGWNPFMNSGEAFYIYSNFFLSSEFIVISILNIIFHLSPDHLINLFILFKFILFFFFAYLLFSEIFRDRFTIFITLSFLMFSGMTESNLVQIAPFFLYTPLLFYLGVLFFRKKQAWILSSMVFIYGVSLNHYNPQYTSIIFFFWAVLLFIPFLFVKKSNENRFKTKPVILSFFVLFIIAAAPFVYSAYEITKTGLSPTRDVHDFKKMGSYITPRKGIQPGCFIPLVRYKCWYQNPFKTGFYNNLIYHHSVYFVGIVPIFLVLFSIAFIFKRDLIYLSFVILIFISYYLSLGPATLIWKSLTTLPMFALRHGFIFSQFTTLILIILSGYGVSFLCRHKSKYTKVMLSIIWALTTIPTTIALTKTSHCLASVPSLMADIKPFVYPENRTFTPPESTPIPFDHASFFAGLASATTTHTDDNVFFRTFQYDNLLRSKPEFTVGPIFGFYESLNQIKSVREPVLVNGIKNGAWSDLDHTSTYRVNCVRKISPDTFRICNTVPSDFQYECIDFIDNKPGVIDYHFTEVPIVNGAIYKIYFDMKVERPGNKADIWITAQNEKPLFTSVSPEIFKDWQTVELMVDASLSSDFTVRISSGGKVFIRNAFIYMCSITKPFMVITPDKISTPNKVYLSFEAPKAGYLVRRENNHNGWIAKIDGKKTDFIKNANPLNGFQILPVNIGKHQVEYSFKSFYSKLMYGHVLATIIGYFLLFFSLIRFRK